MLGVQFLFLFLNFAPKVVTNSCPNLSVDFDVHNFVQLFRQLKSDVVDFACDKDSFVELFNIFRKLLYFRIASKL